MINPKNRRWSQYTSIVIESIIDSFPPITHYASVTGKQLVRSGKAVYEGSDEDQVIRDFSDVSWDQVSDKQLCYHSDAFFFMSAAGIAKFLPAYLRLMVNGKHECTNAPLEFALLDTTYSIIPLLDRFQLECCILGYLGPSDFPLHNLSTLVPASVNEPVSLDPQFIAEDEYDLTIPRVLINNILCCHQELSDTIRTLLKSINEDMS